VPQPATGDDDIGPGFGQRTGEASTQSAARTRDDRDTSGDSEQVKYAFGRLHGTL
jgi:hypothetical protein